MEDKKVFEERDFTYAYSSFGLRLLAYIIDMMVVSAFYSIIKFILPIDPDVKILGLGLIEALHTLICIIYFTILSLSLIHISEPTRQDRPSRMPSSA